MTNGYFYCVYSEDEKRNKYFKEFLVSYNSLKKQIPDCNVTLYTNIKFDNTYDLNIIYEENIDKRLICKAEALLKSPYDKTIFLDTDIVIHKKIINDIFNVLDEFDFTCCYGNSGNYRGQIYPELNTGLLGVKNNDFTKELINIWISNYEGGPDQCSFRKNVFMNNKKNFNILPTYFMFRDYHYKFYPEQAVLTHSHSMSKIRVIKNIINFWIDKNSNLSNLKLKSSQNNL